MAVYQPRSVDPLINTALGAVGGLVLEGVRACGKTSTGLQHCASSIRLDASPQVAESAQTFPEATLTGQTPRLVDEWQLAPALWNAMRHEIDRRSAPGQFILSGSASPADDITRHSGAGRVARIRMRTMSLHETGESSGDVSLAELFNNPTAISGTSTLGLDELITALIRGGWPGLLGADESQANFFLEAYLANTITVGIPETNGVRHDPQQIRRLITALARNISTEIRTTTLGEDVGGAEHNVDPKTIRTYYAALERVFLVEELPAWHVSLRTRSRLRSQPKVHFVDPSIACSALGATGKKLRTDLAFLGMLFESLAIRDLRVYASVLRGNVLHYRDNTGHEVDAIIELPDGRWAACEVKLGENRVPAGEQTLLKLRNDRVDLDRAGAPAFLAVITATPNAYTLPSGVHVIPLGALRP